MSAMTTKEALTVAMHLLDRANDAMKGDAAWGEVLGTLLAAEITDTPDVSDEPATDVRWHEYVVAAIRHGHRATGAAIIADGVLKAAKRQASTGFGTEQ